MSSRRALLHIDIDFPPNGQDTIIVCEGDDPLELATIFGRKHRLKASSIPLIADHIRSTIEDVLYNNSQSSSPEKSMNENLSEKKNSTSQQIPSDSQFSKDRNQTHETLQDNSSEDTWDDEENYHLNQKSLRHDGKRSNSYLSAISSSSFDSLSQSSQQQQQQQPKIRTPAMIIAEKRAEIERKRLEEERQRQLRQSSSSSSISSSASSILSSSESDQEDYGEFMSSPCDLYRGQSEATQVPKFTSPTSSSSIHKNQSSSNDLQSDKILHSDDNNDVGKLSLPNPPQFPISSSRSSSSQQNSHSIEHNKPILSSSSPSRSIEPPLSRQISEETSIASYSTSQFQNPNSKKDSSTIHEQQKSISKDNIREQLLQKGGVVVTSGNIKSPINDSGSLLNAQQQFVDDMSTFLRSEEQIGQQFNTTKSSSRRPSSTSGIHYNLPNSLNTNELNSPMKVTSPDLNHHYDSSSPSKDELSLEESNTNDSEEESAHMYNQLRRSTTQLRKRGGGISSVNLSSAPQKSLAMSRNDMKLRPAAEMDPSQLVGKTAHERLFKTAELTRRKQQATQEARLVSEAQRLQQEQYRMNDTSRRLTNSSHRQRHEERDVGERLYSEGLKEIEQRRLADEKRRDSKTMEVRDWSCAKCGSFHRIGESHRAVTKWIDNPNELVGENFTVPTGGVAVMEPNGTKKDVFRCTNCGWETTAIELFKPTNVGLLLNDDPESLLRGRKQQSTYGGGESVMTVDTIHDYLHSAAKHNGLHWHADEWVEKHSFRPTIPSGSQAIIARARQGGGVHSTEDRMDGFFEDFESLTDDGTMLTTTTSDANGKKKLSGTALAEYLARDTTDRLVSKKTLSRSLTHQLSNSVTAARTSPRTQLSSSAQQELTERLVNEHKEKSLRRSQEQQRHLTFDDKGRKLFQPVIPTIPDSILGGVSLNVSHDGGSHNGSRPKIWEDILRRDEEMAERKLRRQQETIERNLRELKSKQVRALPTSNEILENSTRRNMEELFKLLLASVDEASTSTSSSIENNDNLSSSISPTNSKGVDKNLKDSPMHGLESKLDRIQVQANSISDWQKRDLDLLQVDPALLVSEVSTLLVDMKALRYLQWQKRSCPETNTNTKENGEDESYIDERNTHGDIGNEKQSSSSKNSMEPMHLLTSFDSFCKLARACIKQRDGPGRGYIYAPRKKPEVALAMRAAETNEETFHPRLDPTSIEIAKSVRPTTGNGGIAIEELLHDNGRRMKEKLSRAMQEQVLREAKELTFQPTLVSKLYQNGGIEPSYRGLSILDDETIVSKTNDKPFVIRGGKTVKQSSSPEKSITKSSSPTRSSVSPLGRSSSSQTVVRSPVAPSTTISLNTPPRKLDIAHDYHEEFSYHTQTPFPGLQSPPYPRSMTFQGTNDDDLSSMGSGSHPSSPKHPSLSLQRNGSTEGKLSTSDLRVSVGSNGQPTTNGGVSTSPPVTGKTRSSVVKSANISTHRVPVQRKSPKSELQRSTPTTFGIGAGPGTHVGPIKQTISKRAPLQRNAAPPPLPCETTTQSPRMSATNMSPRLAPGLPMGVRTANARQSLESVSSTTTVVRPKF